MHYLPGVWGNPRAYGPSDERYCHDLGEGRQWGRRLRVSRACPRPVPGRAGRRAIAPSRLGIALVNAAVQIVAAVCIISVLRRNRGRHSLWMAAPTLMLVTLNVE